MDGADAFAVSSGAWSLVRGYFSPGTLFLLLNVVIGTIALTSRSHRRDDDRYHLQQHCRDQLRYAPPPPPAPLARSSSVMERLRSLGLYRFRSGDFPPEYNHHFSAATDGVSDASSTHHAQYIRSRSEPAARPPPVHRNKEEAVVRAVKKKSTSEAKKLERAPAQAKVRRAPRLPRAVVARREEADAAAVSVDARADDFINRFRQQLRLQRLNYKEMLNRGT